MTQHTITTTWKPWQKIGFRFAFLFLGLLSAVCWDLNLFFAASTITKNGYDLGYIFKFMVTPLYWLDRHLFHIGYNPKIHEAFPQDNHFGMVFYLAVLLVAAIGATIWSILDRNRKGYDKLSFWFNMYLRYTLAITIIGYGIDKFIPVQMQWPSVAGMLTPYGDQSLFRVLWNFMGVSPGYMMLTGGCEIIAGLLLLSGRTLKAGYVFLLTIMVNVVALNWFYNVVVKMFSLQLLIYNLYLLGPYFNELIRFFFYNDVAKRHTPHFAFDTRWKKHSLSGLLVLIPLLLCVITLIGTINRYHRQKATLKNEKMYEVTTFIAKDTLPPLTTDTVRWKMLLFAKNRAVIVNMQGDQDFYQVDTNRTIKTLTLHDNDNKATWKTFHYNYLPKGDLELSGKWKGKDVKIFMKPMPIDSLPLNKEKIKLLTD